MKTDRELLELAAKAAGIEVWSGRGHQEDMLFTRLKKPDPTGKCSGVEWNPLTDDGDALRLAIELHINIAEAQAGMDWDEADRFALTRRAIVLAAAAIGESKK